MCAKAIFRAVVRLFEFIELAYARVAFNLILFCKIEFELVPTK